MKLKVVRGIQPFLLWPRFCWDRKTHEDAELRRIGALSPFTSTTTDSGASLRLGEGSSALTSGVL
jgi:hypothetical protein